jgi:hypothetical protein
MKSGSVSEMLLRRTTLIIAVGLPLGKIGGFGLIPYSSVGYQIQTSSDAGVNSRYDG